MLFVVAAIAAAQASSPKFFQAATQADFLKGDVENLSIDSRGQLLLGPAIELVYETDVTDDAWHMLTFVSNGGTKTIYVDGVATTMTQTAFDNADPATLVRIGYNIDTQSGLDGNVNYGGLLDEMKFFDIALTPAQIASLFSSNSVPLGTGVQYLPTSTPVSR